MVLAFLFLGKKSKPSRKTIDWKKLKKILKAKLGKKCTLYLVDQKYKTTSVQEVRKFLEKDETDEYKYTKTWFDCPIPLETAYAFGLFFADGYCNLRKKGFAGASWSLTNTKKELLEKAKVGFEKIPEDNLNFFIKTYPCEKKGAKTNYGERKNSLYHLEVKVKERHNDGVRGRFIRNMRDMFYVNNQKIVPAPIIDAPLECKRAFLEGVFDGDGETKKRRGGAITVQGKAALAALMKLMRDLRWTCGFMKEKRRKDVFYLYFGRRGEEKGYILDYLQGKDFIPLMEIARALNISYYSCSYYIKELEKEGYLLVERPWAQRKNVKLIKEYNLCDDFSFRLMGQFSTPKMADLAFGIAISQTHAYNIFVDSSEKIYIIEPQTDNILPVEEAAKKEEYKTIFVMM